MAFGYVRIRTQKKERLGDLQVHDLCGPDRIGARVVLWGGSPGGIEAELCVEGTYNIDFLIKGLVEVRNKMRPDQPMEFTHVREDKDSPPEGGT